MDPKKERPQPQAPRSPNDPNKPGQNRPEDQKERHNPNQNPYKR